MKGPEEGGRGTILRGKEEEGDSREGEWEGGGRGGCALLKRGGRGRG